MPSAVVKFSNSPLKFMDDAFEKLVIHEGKRTDELLRYVIDTCKQELADGLSNKLPLLTSDSMTTIQSGTLVRYRCMIQDMREPEYFQSFYSTVDGSSKLDEERLHCSLWRENLEILDGHEFNDDGPRHETSERHVLVGSSIPAETDWARRYYVSEVGCRGSTVTSDQTDVGHSATAQCLLKVYCNGDQVKLNDVLEIVGIYYRTDSAQARSGAHAVALPETAPMQSETIKPIPCLHAFNFDKLVHHHPDLSLPNGATGESQSRSQLMRTLNGSVPLFRSRLIDAFKRHLFRGDELVSEYFLCHLMSSVYARDVGMAFGQFTLNILNVFTKDFGLDWTSIRLRPFLEELLTQVCYLPLSLSTLNHASLVSRKCYETDRLISGLLQLPKGTELIIDETKLDAGRLDTQGVNNMAALRGMIKWQKLDYDFGFNTCEFSTDLRTLIISEGPSILPTDFSVPLRPQQSDSATGDLSSLPQISFLDDKEFIEQARLYFALAPTLAFSFDENMQTRIQEDFVAMRRDGGNNITGEYLHHLLTLARMLSLSSGDSRLRMEIWEKAKCMEAERQDRLKK